MGWFLQPSEKVIRGYRDTVQIVAPEDPLPIRFDELKLLNFKPSRFQIAAITKNVESPSLSFAAQARKADFSLVCLSEQVDPTVLPNAPSNAELHFHSLEVRHGNLISIDDISALRNTHACDSLVASVKEVRLICASDLQVRQVDLANFNIVIKRFSFPSVQNDPTATTLFDQPTAPRGDNVQVAPVIRPDPPPSLNKADLHERLRWLLTPPIHEVLSDPQLALPEKPFPYQTYGIKWLYDRGSALLADEMGLGKTMQAIIAARLLWRDGSIKQILIVCPKSLIPNWRKELGIWWPGVSLYTKVVESDRQWFLRLSSKDIVVNPNYSPHAQC